MEFMKIHDIEKLTSEDRWFVHSPAVWSLGGCRRLIRKDADPPEMQAEGKWSYCLGSKSINSFSISAISGKDFLPCVYNCFSIKDSLFVSRVQALIFPPWFPLSLSVSCPQTELLNQFVFTDSMAGFKSVLPGPSSQPTLTAEVNR